MLRRTPVALAFLAVGTGCNFSLPAVPPGPGPDTGIIIMDAAADASSPEDARPDAGFEDAQVPDGADPADTGPDPDAGFMDADPPDTGPPDTGVPAFPYVPSNFTPTFEATVGDVIVDCNAIYNTDTLAFDLPCDALAFAVTATLPTDPETIVVDTLDFMVTAGSTLRIVGARPIIFAVYRNADILGTIDVSGFETADGPGGNADATCVAGRGVDGAPSNALVEGGGGGGGGGFGTPGQRGGDDATPNLGGDGGAVEANPTLIPLRGGCAGGLGGTGASGAATRGAPGGAGGAVQISAAGSLVVSGLIDASGSGGRGGGRRTGGAGGGGSGGGVLLEADQISLRTGTIITTNGGGGGEGGTCCSNGQLVSDFGQPGWGVASPGNGGSGLTDTGGDGGDGAIGSTPPTGGDTATRGGSFNDSGGGGGGGGGLGVIVINTGSCTVAQDAVLSPSVACP